MSVLRVDLGEIDYRTAIDTMAGWADERRAGTAPTGCSCSAILR
ncbi:hypothetical protein [Actinoplanes couchii]|nr:hypothetical protein [Actinoplanes couchii]MDR6317888.1 hypothetical protein [Actinoplanes couchii]